MSGSRNHAAAGWLGILLAFVGAGQARALPPAPSRAPAWETMAPGAERARLAASDGTPIQLYRFSLARYRPDVIVGAGWPPRLETAAELRRRRGGLAAVNGGFFDERRAPLGLRISLGQPRVPVRPHVDWGVLLLDGDTARIVHSRDLPAKPAARGAIQVGPRLVVGGAALKLKPQRARRTAVALDRDGRTLTLVVVDAPIDANELASALAANGFDAALMLDGGPSTQLSLEVGAVKADLPGGYPVPDLLVIGPADAGATDAGAKGR
jgi:uncharacterized protein YigE (DUF2233 family)